MSAWNRGRRRPVRVAVVLGATARLLLCASCTTGSAMAQSPDPAAQAQRAGRADVVAPSAGVPAAAIPEVVEAADGLYVEFGRGVTLRSAEGGFGLTIRGRVQTRATLRTSDTPGEDLDLWFQIRRSRLVFIADQPAQKLQLYIQVGLGPSDLDDEDPVPLRDAQVIWSPLRDLSVRVGQMKVPFSRERLVSSSALQFADRSRLNAEFNLDRDVGVQIFSHDLFGLGGLIDYQAGIYGGAGQNRTDPGVGVLVVGRVSVQPLGRFADAYVEADLKRSSVPRLSLGAAVARHTQAHRVRVTHGADLEGPPRRTLHVAADAIFKWSGWSLQTEAVYRVADPAVATASTTEGEDPMGDVKFAHGFGYMASLGHVFESGWEVAGRFVRIAPQTLSTDAEDSTLTGRNVGTACLGYYFLSHNLKVQADYEVTALDGASDPLHEARLQLQVYF